MQTTHTLNIDSDNGAEIVLVCPEDTCRRRVVVARSGGFVVIDQGDFFARHVGVSGGLRVTASVGA
jgi:hypothetical protein